MSASSTEGAEQLWLTFMMHVLTRLYCFTPPYITHRIQSCPALIGFRLLTGSRFYIKYTAPMVTLHENK